MLLSSGKEVSESSLSVLTGRFEAINPIYASLTQLIREKVRNRQYFHLLPLTSQSFMFVLILRFSAVPGHITTAVSASAGASFPLYLLAAFLTLPKQFTIVYLGQAFGSFSTTNTIISWTTTVVTLLATGVAAVWIWYQMRLVMRRKSSLPTTVDEFIEANPTLAYIEATSRRPSAVPTLDIKPDPVQMQNGINDVDSVPAAVLARRPWLMDKDAKKPAARVPTRGWSVPHHMSEDEMRDWRRELDDEPNLPIDRVDEVDEEETDDEKPIFRPSFESANTPHSRFNHSVASTPPESMTPVHEAYPPSPIASTQPNSAHPLLGRGTAGFSPISSTDSSAILDAESSRRPRAISRAASNHVGRLSLDLGRVPATRWGGREVAEDADEYAYEHGSHRPQFSTRGESQYALLGRDRADTATSSTISGLSGISDAQQESGQRSV